MRLLYPWRWYHPLRRVELDPHNFATYQGLTGGNIQTHELRNPNIGALLERGKRYTAQYPGDARRVRA